MDAFNEHVCDVFKSLILFVFHILTEITCVESENVGFVLFCGIFIIFFVSVFYQGLGLQWMGNETCSFTTGIF